MAKRNSNPEAAALFEAERADREENADVNEAIARTDSEVFTDAMGEEPLDDEAGTELEEMGDGLEGEELDEEEEAEPEVTAAEEGEVPEAQAQAEGEEQPEGEVEEAPAPQERPQPSIPPRVLRETRERARETENELRAQLRDMQMRIDNLSRQPAPTATPVQPASPPANWGVTTPAPDMFADPEGYRNWVLNEAEKRAEVRFETRFTAMQQQQQQREMDRLNESLAATASGPRAYEFNVAHRDLTSLERSPENAALVRRLVSQPDPGQAILDWWEKSSNPEYVEYHRNQLRQIYAPQQPAPRQGPIGRQLQQNGYRQPVRHEVRLPRSLSEASGGRSQHISDAEMSDGSEESVFAYGARR